MSRVNKFLFGLLAVQIVIAALVLLRGGHTVTLRETAIIPGFDSSTVTRVQVFENSGTKPAIDAVKRGKDWVLTSAYDYPVDPAKVGAALGPLAKMTTGEPVATTSARHKQLRVGDTDFDKKLIVTADGKDITLFIGTTAGLRRTAVRIAGEERVLGATGISASGISTAPKEWIVKGYFELAHDQVSRVEVKKDKSPFVIERVPPPAPAGSGSGSGSGSAGSGSGAGAPPPPEWRVTIDGTPVTLAPGEKLDTFALETVLSETTSVEAMPADPKRDVSKPFATVTITKKDNSTVIFDVLLEGETQYWVKLRNLDRATKVDRTRLEGAMGGQRSTLVNPADPSAKPGGGSGSGAPPRRPEPPRPNDD